MSFAHRSVLEEMRNKKVKAAQAVERAVSRWRPWAESASAEWRGRFEELDAKTTVRAKSHFALSLCRKTPFLVLHSHTHSRHTFTHTPTSPARTSTHTTLGLPVSAI